MKRVPSGRKGSSNATVIAEAPAYTRERHRKGELSQIASKANEIYSESSQLRSRDDSKIKTQVRQIKIVLCVYIRLNILFLTILFHLSLSRDRCWRHWQGHSELITQRTEYNDWYSNQIYLDSSHFLISFFFFYPLQLKNLLLIRSFTTTSFFFVMFALAKFHREKNGRIGARPNFGNWIPFQSKHYPPIMSVGI